MKRNKKGVSPVIATVLLIAIVVVISVIIFVWFNQIVEESITKFGGMNIELVCEEISFDATYSYGSLSIVNTGDVPIFGMKIKIVGEGSHETQSLSEISDWPELGLNQGGSFSGEIGSEIGNAESIVLIPVLIGSSERGEKTFVCDEKNYGHEIFI
jgi:flagellin-like protein